MINGERVKQARELRALTQVQLAERVDVTQATIAYIEAGTFQPSEEVVNAMALVTGFPVSFFKQEMAVDFPMGSLLFRARSNITSAQKQQARRYAQILFEVASRLASRLKMGPLRLPRITDDPRIAATLTRSELGLSPDTPVEHVTFVIEKAGVLVLAVPIALEGRDAFSVWVGAEEQKPVIVLPGGASGDRLRWSIAHELGHLVMHQTLIIKGNLSELEDQANQFASEFLLPEVAMRREMIAPITPSGLVDLKKRWKVSIQALIHRARDLEIITERQYRYLFEQISAAGWRKNEPGKLPIERPRALRKMAELSYGNPIDYQRLASDVKLTSQFVRQLMEAHIGKDELGGASARKEPDAPGGKLVPFDRDRSKCS